MKLRFWTFTLAATVSKAGNQLLYVAIPWAILQTSRSSILAVVSLGIQSIPYVASPLLGGIVDRYDRRHVFTLSELMQGVSVALLPWFISDKHLLALFLLLLMSGLGGVVSGLTSDYGLIPSIVSPWQFAWANSRYTIAIQGARFVGPALAGILLLAVGERWTIWIDALSFLATAMVAQLLPSRTKESRPTGRLSTYFFEGFRAFRSYGAIRNLTLTLTIYNLGTGGIFALLVTVVTTSWHWSAGLLGFALSGGAAAGAGGAWLAALLWRTRTANRRILLWLCICALGAVILLLPVPLAALLGYYVLCTGESGLNVISMTLRQEVIPSEVTGRVNALVRMFALGSIPLSSVLLSAASSLSVQSTVFIPTALAVVGALLLWIRWLRREKDTGKT